MLESLRKEDLPNVFIVYSNSVLNFNSITFNEVFFNLIGAVKLRQTPSDSIFAKNSYRKLLSSVSSSCSKKDRLTVKRLLFSDVSLHFSKRRVTSVADGCGDKYPYVKYGLDGS